MLRGRCQGFCLWLVSAANTAPYRFGTGDARQAALLERQRYQLSRPLSNRLWH